MVQSQPEEFLFSKIVNQIYSKEKTIVKLTLNLRANKNLITYNNDRTTKKFRRDFMSHTVKIYDTCIGCTQCVRACPTDVLEMVIWEDCRAGQIASAPRTEDCVGCKRCESACPTDFLSVRVYLGGETTRSMGLAY